jgi:hypothetical protein
MNDSYALLSDNVIYRKDEISCSCIYGMMSHVKG